MLPARSALGRAEDTAPPSLKSADGGDEHQMRALGPGSVSSVLKVILDVVFHALWVLAAALLVGSIIAIVVALSPGTAQSVIHNANAHVIVADAPRAAFEASAATLYTVGVILIVGRLRRLFASLTAGDPFHPDNVRRLQVIAFVLGALEVGRYAAAFVAGLLHLGPSAVGAMSLTPWFAVLVVTVLAEVFREGARLRREAELTI